MSESEQPTAIRYHVDAVLELRLQQEALEPDQYDYLCRIVARLSEETGEVSIPVVARALEVLAETWGSGDDD